MSNRFPRPPSFSPPGAFPSVSRVHLRLATTPSNVRLLMKHFLYYFSYGNQSLRGHCAYARAWCLPVLSNQQEGAWKTKISAPSRCSYRGKDDTSSPGESNGTTALLSWSIYHKYSLTVASTGHTSDIMTAPVNVALVENLTVHWVFEKHWVLSQKSQDNQPEHGKECFLWSVRA